MYWSDKYKSIYFCLKLLSSVWALAILQLIIARQETTMTMDPSHYTNNKFNQLKMKLINLSIAFFLSLCISTGCSTINSSKAKRNVLDNISGEKYDWTITGQPERPYMHAYHKSIMMKMMMASYKDGRFQVNVNYEEALKNIIAIDKLTRGVPKIIYLVGWQYDGHDSKYPAFFEFNEKLKRDQDATAADSYFWLRKEAKKYNTTISVHINLNDAYENSPLFDMYLQKDLFNKWEDGSFQTNGVWGGLKSYSVNLTKEWELGLTKERIDRVVKLLDLQKSKTVHIDAFFPRESPFHGTTRVDNTKIMRKIFRYFRNLGIDVTSELAAMHQEEDSFVGLRPATWAVDFSAEVRSKIPPYMAAGGISADGLTRNLEKEFLFGSNMLGEPNILKGNTNFPQFRNDFGIQSLVYLYLNTHKLENYDAGNKVVTYSNGLIVDWPNRTYKKNGILVREANDIFLPAVWLKKEIIAYSEKGYVAKTWTLPSGWEKVKAVDIYTLNEKGVGAKKTVNVVNGQVTLSMGVNQLLSIKPAH